jgi:hypothetical protein
MLLAERALAGDTDFHGYLLWLALNLNVIPGREHSERTRSP